MGSVRHFDAGGAQVVGRQADRAAVAGRVLSWFVASLLLGLCLVGWLLDASLAGRDQAVDPTARARPLRLRADTPVLSRGLRSTTLPSDSVALTFSGGDDGTWLGDVGRLLARDKVPATFFVSGEAAVHHADEVAALGRAGVELGANGYSNVDLANLADWQVRLHLSVTETLMASAVGQTTRLFRPPGARALRGVDARDIHIADLATGAGYSIVFADRVVPLWNHSLGPFALAALAVPANGTSAVVEFPTPDPDHRAEALRVVEFVVTVLRGRGTHLTDVSHYAGLSRAAIHQSASGADRIRGTLLALALPVLGGARVAVHILAVLLLVIGLARLAGGMIIALRNRRHGGLQTRPPPLVGARYAPHVTVLIAARDESAVIGATLIAISHSGYRSFDVVVVDDGSTDGTAEVAAATGRAAGPDGPVVSIFRQEGLGKPAALNHGLLFASGEIVVCIDADTVIEADTVERLVEPFVDPSVGAVTGHVLVANATGLLGRFQRAEYAVGCTIERGLLNSIGFMTCVSGAIGAYRSATLREVGGFSSDTCAEDTDLALTLQRAGWSAVYQPAARAHTTVPLTVRELWTQRVRWSLGVLQSMWKHRAAVASGGQSGRFGRRALPYLAVFGGLSVLGPIVDAVAIFAVLTARLDKLVIVWAVLVAITTSVTAVAFVAEGQPVRQAWVAPLQSVLFRPLLYLAQIRALQLGSVGLSPAWRRAARVVDAPVAATVVDLRESPGLAELRAAR